jgi:N6-L-threonylcarbamoyladenine synthase
VIVLGIETSCDETAAAVVERREDGAGVIRSNVVLSQLEEHAAFGGVVPEIAARAHVEALDGVIEAALAEAGVALGDIDAVAATAGPGLIGGVLVGLNTGKALALAARKPLVAVNHLEAHALTARLTDGLDFPYLLLLVSGGHTQIVRVDGVGEYTRYGSTIDDALGEAFDKTARLLGLPYPGGPEVERVAVEGDPERFALPRPLVGRPGSDFSFSGLKTAVRLAAEERAPLGAKDVADLAASFQAAVAEVLGDRVTHAMNRFREESGIRTSPSPRRGEGRGEGALPPPERSLNKGTRPEGAGAPHPHPASPDGEPVIAASPHRGEVNDERPALVLAGGVAANKVLRAALVNIAEANGFRLVVPPPVLCTDNGAMVAWAGAERLALGLEDRLDAPARPRWPLDARDPAGLWGGAKGARA